MGRHPPGRRGAAAALPGRQGRWPGPTTVAEKGGPNPNAVTAAGVAAAAAAAAPLPGLAAVEGALLNVDINLGGLHDEEYKKNVWLAAEAARAIGGDGEV